MPLHEISTAVKVSGPHRRQALFERLQDLESFPRWMQGMVAVELLRRGGQRGVSRWAIEVHGCPVGWVQEDHFDAARSVWRFDGREGDFDFLSGSWSVRPEDGGSILQFESRWDMGVPIIDDLLGRSLEARMRDAAARLLEAVRADVQGQPVQNERHDARLAVRMRAGVRADGARGLGRITDISRHGARLYIGAPLLIPGERFVLIPGDASLPRRVEARVAWTDPDGVVGVRFVEPLGDVRPLASEGAPSRARTGTEGR